MSLKASFIGLGSMGNPMALNLLNQGVDLAVYNRSKEKAAPLVAAGAKLLNHPNEAFKHAPLVFSMLANDEALEEITIGTNGLLAGAYSGCIHVSSSTVAPTTTHKMVIEHEKKGVHLVAAPVFGRPEAAAKKELWICLAGDEMSKKTVEPYLNLLGKKVYDFGNKPEAVNAVKLAGNFMILSVVEMLGEAFALVKKSGVEPEKFHSFLIDSLFPSPVFQNYGKLLIQQKFSPAGFKLTLGLKDINLFLDASRGVETFSPFAELLQEQLLKSIDRGREEMDWSAVSLLALEGSK